MQKIPSFFKRDYTGTHLVYNEVVPGSEWVLAGEGIATRKFDGTACLIRDGRLYKRYDKKPGRIAPPEFEPCGDPDPVTGHHPGWIPVRLRPDDQWYREAQSNSPQPLSNGTYELCGPKIQGNPERFETHRLVRHGSETLPDAPHTFDELKTWFAEKDIEGIVWHHPDGRMVKIKKRDFGLLRSR